MNLSMMIQKYSEVNISSQSRNISTPVVLIGRGLLVRSKILRAGCGVRVEVLSPEHELLEFECVIETFGRVRLDLRTTKD